MILAVILAVILALAVTLAVIREVILTLNPARRRTLTSVRVRNLSPPLQSHRCSHQQPPMVGWLQSHQLKLNINL